MEHGGHAFDRSSTVDVLLGVLSGAVVVPSVSHPGESMYRMNARWIDLYDWEDIPWPAGTANFCIKALAVDAGSSAARTYRAVFDARALPAGMYVATLITEHGSVSRKLALVK